MKWIKLKVFDFDEMLRCVQKNTSELYYIPTSGNLFEKLFCMWLNFSFADADRPWKFLFWLMGIDVIKVDLTQDTVFKYATVPQLLPVFEELMIQYNAHKHNIDDDLTDVMRI